MDDVALLYIYIYIFLNPILSDTEARPDGKLGWGAVGEEISQKGYSDAAEMAVVAAEPR